MTDPLIREVAEELAREAFLDNWKLHVFLITLTALAAAAGSFIVSYFQKRAETYATKADLEEILTQVRRTTEVSEQVRAAVSHADWLAREWKTVRRTKLEELLQTALSLEQWLDQERAFWFFGAERKDPVPPADRVAMLTALYFPELQNESMALSSAQLGAHAWQIRIGERAFSAKDNREKEAIFMQAAPEWTPLHEAVRQAVSNLTERAAAYMQGLRDA